MPKRTYHLPIALELEEHLELGGVLPTLSVEEIEIGDIIQVDPEVLPDLHAAVMIVTEIKHWGIQAYLSIPRYDEDDVGGNAFYRVAHGAFKKVGHCAWIREE